MSNSDRLETTAPATQVPHPLPEDEDDDEDDDAVDQPTPEGSARHPTAPAPLRDDLPCLFCDANKPWTQQDCLKHLLEEHHFVIAEADQIANLPKYLAHWRGRFKEQPIETLVTVIKGLSAGAAGAAAPTPSSALAAPPVASAVFYLLSDVLPEDKHLRRQLHEQRLNDALSQQSKEREDTMFKKRCLFCKFIVAGNRAVLLDHMMHVHSFNIGLPDNLVFVEEYLDILAGKLNDLKCLYCEKTFKSRDALKNHMRKKRHVRVHPQNKEYDRFYMINYLGPAERDEASNINNNGSGSSSTLVSTGTSSQPKGLQASSGSYSNRQSQRKPAGAHTGSQPSTFVSSGAGAGLSETHDNDEHGLDEHGLDEDDEHDDSQWDDWEEESEEPIACLFCPHASSPFTATLAHMKETHTFDLEDVKRQWKLDFYSTIKLVNYIRRQIMLCKCPRCDTKFSSASELNAHMAALSHCSVVREADFWQQAEYFFPTIENDPFLYNIQDDEEITDAAREGESEELK